MWKSADHLIKTHILLVSAVIAHILSGGVVVEPATFLPLLLMISTGIFLTRNVQLEGAPLALMVLLMQSAGHFILGAGSHTSDLKMTTGHVVGGLVSYHLIQRCEQLWQFIADSASRIFLRISDVRITLQKDVKPLQVRELVSRIEVLFTTFSFRGPPAGVQI
jgi:hypothetical protein